MRYSPASEPGYLFVDGGHLRESYSKAVQPWFGSPGEIDFLAVDRSTTLSKFSITTAWTTLSAKTKAEKPSINAWRLKS